MFECYEGGRDAIQRMGGYSRVARSHQSDANGVRTQEEGRTYAPSSLTHAHKLSLSLSFALCGYACVCVSSYSNVHRIVLHHLVFISFVIGLISSER